VAVVLTGLAVAAVLANQAAVRQRDYRTLLLRGDTLLRAGDTFRAAEAYSGAIALRPDAMLAYLRRGETYRRDGDLKAAARDFHAASMLDALAVRPLEELGDVRYQQQRYVSAMGAYERCVQLDDRSARLSYKLALARFRAGETSRAIGALDQTLRLDDRMPEAHYLLGLCLRQQGRNPEALKSLERAIQLAPGMIAAREELADLLGALDRRADQIEQLQLLAGLDRDHVERHIALGLAHARRRRWDAAVVTLGGALEHTREPELYQALGRVWLESARARGDAVELRKAREALDPVAATPGASSEALLVAGQAALDSGDVDLAERTLQHATERFPIEPAALLAYATVAERQNHLDNARRALIQFCALAGDDTELVQRAAKIAALSLKVNDVATAAAWIKRGQDRDAQNATLASLADRVKRASLAQ
jgi:tetratricopeptide (TPR) repeat protein